MFERGLGASSPGYEAGASSPARAKAFKKGDRVEHPKFGPGLVIKREMNAGNAFVTVYFERNYRTVKLAEAHAKLEPGRR